MVNLNELIGKHYIIGIDMCNLMGYTYRIVKEDLSVSIITMDLKFDRVNFVINSDIIVDAYLG